jgi:NitT/TauT family transport system ATP-binding protein
MIRLLEVSHRFAVADAGGGATALQQVSLQAAPAEFVCLLGPSGCGKSTLLNLVAGFLRPSAGQLLFDGRPINGAGPERGVVFQEPTLFPWLTAAQNVAFGLTNGGLDQAEIARRCVHWLQLVGLENQGGAYPHELSGGMRQRVALARVMALEPRALLMDEPFSALDANARERLQDLLLKVWAARPRTVLFVTHQVEEAVYLADRVVIMGAPPDSLHSELTISLPRPRERESSALRSLVKELRRRLGELPCCLGSTRLQRAETLPPFRSGKERCP